MPTNISRHMTYLAVLSLLWLVFMPLAYVAKAGEYLWRHRQRRVKA